MSVLITVKYSSPSDAESTPESTLFWPNLFVFFCLWHWRRVNEDAALFWFLSYTMCTQTNTHTLSLSFIYTGYTDRSSSLFSSSFPPPPHKHATAFPVWGYTLTWDDCLHFATEQRTRTPEWISYQSLYTMSRRRDKQLHCNVLWWMCLCSDTTPCCCSQDHIVLTHWPQKIYFKF